MKFAAVVPVGTDKEADLIASVCRDCDVSVHRPLHNRRIVDHQTARHVDGFDTPIPDDANKVFVVECDGPAVERIGRERTVIVDHHRPGTPGYGMSPESFLDASSIGQVLRAIGVFVWYEDVGMWNIAIPSHYYLSLNPLGLAREVAYTAAADHCLRDAYQGRCLGITTQELKQWRIQDVSRSTGKSIHEVRNAIRQAKKRIEDAIVINGDYHYAKLDAEHETPELLEASAQTGIPVMFTRKEDQHTRLTLHHASSDLVHDFLDGSVIPQLHDAHGDARAGYATGLLKGDEA